MSAGPLVVILVGFDRSGTSMIARSLALNPEVGLVFQPFNSGEVTRKQWEIWPPAKVCAGLTRFLTGLEHGLVDEKYIVSEWNRNYGSRGDPEVERVLLIKDTKLHFKIDWLKANFSEIRVHGVWRNPKGVVCSLMRNGFYEKWYGDDTFKEVRRLIEDRDEFEQFREFLAGPVPPYLKMAIMVAVRTMVLFRRLGPHEVIDYEEVVCSPNSALNAYGRSLGLSVFDYSPAVRRNLNVIGSPPETADLWRDYFDAHAQETLSELFSRLDTRLGASDSRPERSGSRR